jgi:polyphosphate kinase 2 (PPK2 family)
VFEGWDAAGKGGAIRRLTPALDARDYEVISVAAPTDEENAHHYLWRFWRFLPRDGRFLIFDRSWYGRVLVERIEGFATNEEWLRAYEEINDFERQLIEHGSVLVKFWINVTPEEQERRFREREETPYKRWKLTEEDWRNRDRWRAYELAVDDMVRLTSGAAPWHLVEGDNKRFARVRVIDTVCDALDRALGYPLRELDGIRLAND